MIDCAHDVRPIALIVDSVAHGLSINGQTLVLFTIDLAPTLEGVVEMYRIHANQHISYMRTARIRNIGKKVGQRFHVLSAIASFLDLL